MLAQAAGLTFSHIMMDKDRAQISACDELNIFWLLCKFHMLQDFDRYIASTSSGVPCSNSTMRTSILRRLSSLQALADEAVFKAEETTFLSDFGAYSALVRCMQRLCDVAECILAHRYCAILCLMARYVSHV